MQSFFCLCYFASHVIAVSIHITAAFFEPCFFFLLYYHYHRIKHYEYKLGYVDTRWQESSAFATRENVLYTAAREDGSRLQRFVTYLGICLLIA